ncbi:MAG: protein-glutamate O-methyltransferase CheR [Evtepia sp.]
MVHITDPEFEALISFVYKKYGLDLSKKRQLIEGRLSHTLKTKGFSNFGSYLRMVKADQQGDELHLFLNKITTNHSYFARENEHFDFLTNVALPQLEKTRRNDLRIWSAGCSAGQEAYNIAMVIDQYFGPRKILWDTTILATDISTQALAKAKEGIYTENIINGLPLTWRSKYFTKCSDDAYQVTDRIRKEVVFRLGNLMEPFDFKKPFDIIFCRNVMIYFDAVTSARLIDKFYQATAMGGYLFIGHSESIQKDQTQYTYLRPATYQKIPKGV